MNPNERLTRDEPQIVPNGPVSASASLVAEKVLARTEALTTPAEEFVAAPAEQVTEMEFDFEKDFGKLLLKCSDAFIVENLDERRKAIDAAVDEIGKFVEKYQLLLASWLAINEGAKDEYQEFSKLVKEAKTASGNQEKLEKLQEKLDEWFDKHPPNKATPLINFFRIQLRCLQESAEIDLARLRKK